MSKPLQQPQRERQFKHRLPLALRYLDKKGFRLLVSGRTLSGKTTQAVSILKKMKPLCKWDYVYLVCPTDGQETYDPILTWITKTYREADATEEDQDVFSRLIKKVEKHHRDHAKTLIIVDDCAGKHATNTGRKGGLPQLAANSRHMGLTLVIITQNLTSVTKTMRDNSEGIMLFSSMSADEKDIMIKERNPFGDKVTLKEFYEESVSQPFGFLFQLNTTRGVLHFDGLDRFLGSS